MRRQTTRLLTAQLPSDLSDWLDFTAIGALLAFAWQVDTMVFALLAVATGLPYVVVGPLAGVFVDRAGLKPVLVWSNLGKAAVTACFALAGSWPLLLALVFLRNSVDAFFTPAKQATIQAITNDDNRTRINSLSMAINQGAKVVAPGLGGAALLVLEPAQVFLTNAVISLLAVLLLLRLAPVTRPPAGPKGRLRQSLSEGWREVAEKPRLRAGLTLMGIGFFATFFYDTLVPPLVREIGFEAQDLGYLMAAIGAGGVLGALGLASLTIRKPFPIIAVALVTAAVLVIGAGLLDIRDIHPARIAVLGLAVVVGAASAASIVPLRGLIQDETAPERMARVAALSEALNTSVMLVAPFIGAAIARSAGLGWAFVAGGTIALCGALYAARLARTRP